MPNEREDVDQEDYLISGIIFSIMLGYPEPRSVHAGALPFSRRRLSLLQVIYKHVYCII
jgi:hypothetical protein